jgi:hypothetical protein
MLKWTPTCDTRPFQVQSDPHVYLLQEKVCAVICEGHRRLSLFQHDNFVNHIQKLCTYFRVNTVKTNRWMLFRAIITFILTIVRNMYINVIWIKQGVSLPSEQYSSDNAWKITSKSNSDKVRK